MADDWFRVAREGAVHVVELTLPGSLDNADFDRFMDSLLDLVGRQTGARWVLDLSATAYMGSSVLGLMVNVRQRVKQAGGRLVLCGLSPNLTQIFHTCSLERLFHIVRTREDAVLAAG